MVYFVTLISLAVLFFVNLSHHANIHEKKMQKDNPLTSHILDTARGVPAADVETTLFKLKDDGETWKKILTRNTNEDGRLSSLLTDSEFTPGIYKFFFDTKKYYNNLNMKTFYPYVEIVFEIEKPNEHYHVPLLLSPYGYSTYRGS